MKKTIWVCGIMAGTISVTWGVISAGPMSDMLSLHSRLILGYATMILGFSLIFVAIKNYRDTYNNGLITFGKALRIGLLVTLIASTLYVVVWMVDFSYFIPDYGDKYQVQYIAELKASGASAAEVKKQATDLATTMATYKSNALFRVMFTYLEIAPVGIVISMIAALILKKKPKQAPANV